MNIKDIEKITEGMAPKECQEVWCQVRLAMESGKYIDLKKLKLGRSSFG